MPYTNTWDESSPDGSENANTIDTEFQQLKLDIRERMNDLVDDWANDDPQQPKSGYPRCVLSRSGAQALSTGTAEDISWTSEDLDQGGMYAGSGTDIVVPAGLGGLYLITAATLFVASASGTYRGLNIEVGGAAQVSQRNGLTDASISTRMTVSFMGVLSVSDIITVSAVQDTGGNLNITDSVVAAVRLA